MTRLFCGRMRVIAGIVTVMLAVGVSLGLGLHKLLAQEKPATPAAAGEVKVTKEHPRIWLTPEKLAELKARAAANTPEWQRIKAAADQSLTVEPHPAWIRNWYILSLAVVYQVTGDAKYANRAKEFMLEMAKETPKLAGDGYRNAGHLIPLGYDWIHDQLKAEDKKLFGEAVNRWADSEIPIIGMPGKCIRQNDTDQLIGDMRGLMFSGIATYGDNPRASELMSLAEDACRGGRVRYWLQKGTGGVWPEGSVYSPGTLSYLFTGYAQALKSSMNRDYWRETGVPDFPREVLYAWVHELLPGERYTYQFADAEGVGEFQTPTSRQHGLFLGLADQLRGTPEGKHAQYYLSRIWDRTFDQLLYAYDFIWYDRDAPVEDYKGKLPLDYTSTGNGYVFGRTDWGPEATWVVFQTKVLPADHEHHDGGHFSMFRKGVWLTKEDTGYGGRSYWTVAHNSIIFAEEQYPERMKNAYQNGPGGQFWGRGEGEGEVVKYEAGPDYLYALGDETKLYNSTSANWKPVEYFVRAFVFLKPDCVVVFDRTKTKDPAHSKKFILHTYEEPAIEGTRVTAVHKGQKLFVRSLLPEKASITKIQEQGNVYPEKDEGIPQKEMNWQVRIQPTGNQAEDLFLTVLEGTDEATAAMTLVGKVESQKGNAVGAQVGNRVVLFGKTGPIDGIVTYTIDGAGASRQLIVDLKAGSAYKVEDNGKPLGNFKTSQQGSLSFEVQLGGAHTISLRP